MQLSIITPEKTFIEGDAEMVIVPGAEGEFGVLAGHMPFISLLKPGIITVERTGEPNMRIAVIEGIAEANAQGCTILAQTARSLEGVSGADVAAEAAAAEADLQAALTDEQTKAAEKKLLMARTLADALK